MIWVARARPRRRCDRRVPGRPTRRRRAAARSVGPAHVAPRRLARLRDARRRGTGSRGCATTAAACDACAGAARVPAPPVAHVPLARGPGGDGALACAFADADGEHVGVLARRRRAARCSTSRACASTASRADADQLGLGRRDRRARRARCAPGRGRAARRASARRSLVEPPSDAGAGAPRARAVRVRARRRRARRRAVAHHGGRRGDRHRAARRHRAPRARPARSDRSYAPGRAPARVAAGFAVALVDVSGSTAHGRAHRERLRRALRRRSTWPSASRRRAHLVDAGVADPAALFIRGTSAGGTHRAARARGGPCSRARSRGTPRRDFDATTRRASRRATSPRSLGAERRRPLAARPRGASCAAASSSSRARTTPSSTLEETAALCVALRAALEDVELRAVPTARATASAPRRAGRPRSSAELDFYRATAHAVARDRGARGRSVRCGDGAARRRRPHRTTVTHRHPCDAALPRLSPMAHRRRPVRGLGGLRGDPVVDERPLAAPRLGARRDRRLPRLRASPPRVLCVRRPDEGARAPAWSLTAVCFVLVALAPDGPHGARRAPRRAGRSTCCPRSPSSSAPGTLLDRGPGPLRRRARRRAGSSAGCRASRATRRSSRTSPLMTAFGLPSTVHWLGRARRRRGCGWRSSRSCSSRSGCCSRARRPTGRCAPSR